MARKEQALKIREWAVMGDRTDPDDSNLSPVLSRAVGWPASFSAEGGDVPRRSVFNQLFCELSTLAVEINTRGGILDWNAALTYVHPALVRSSNGIIFQSVQGSTNVDPDSDSDNSHWVALRFATEELIYDTVAAILRQGSNITLSKDDDANEITIGATVAGQVSVTKLQVYNQTKTILKVGNGLAIANNDSARTQTLTARIGLGIQFVAGLISAKLKANSGLSVDGDGLRVNLASNKGLQFSSSGGLEIKLPAATALSVGANGLQFALGNGLEIESNSMRIKRPTTSGLALTASGLSINLDGASLSLGNSGVKINLDSNPGLVIGAGGIKVNLGDGLEINSSKIRVDLDGSTLQRSSAGIKARDASTSQKGVVERATDAEVVAGTDTTRYITPKQFADNANRGSVVEDWLFWNSSGLSITDSTTGTLVNLLEDYTDYRELRIMFDTSSSSLDVYDSVSMIASKIPNSRNNRIRVGAGNTDAFYIWRESDTAIRLQSFQTGTQTEVLFGITGVKA